MDRPFDLDLIGAMVYAAWRTSKTMMGFKLAYVQSDECTFVLTDLDSLDAQPWFEYNVQKLASITAATFTAHFNRRMNQFYKKDLDVAVFDGRAFNVPLDDVANNIVWRQKDWERNSVQMFARGFCSHSELQHKKMEEIHEMLHNKNQNWAHLNPILKNGVFIDKEKKLFSRKMGYNSITELIEPEEDTE
jgi:tRNA(His) 5'-end guanylyltransferase